MNAGLAVLLVIYLGFIFMSFYKGRSGLALLGVAGLIPPFGLILGWFPVVGALRLAKPDSAWARSRYGPRRMAEAQSRFGTPNAEVAAEPTPDPALPPPPTGLPNRSDDSEQQSARAAIAAFLRRALEEGIVDPATHERLRLLLDRGWSRQAPPWSAPSQTAAGEHVEETTPSYAPSVNGRNRLPRA